MGRARHLLWLAAAMGTVASGVIAGCATIMHGRSQEIAVASQPTGAKITIDSTVVGVTPVTVRLARKRVHTIVIALEGYQPFAITTIRHTSGWVWGNVVFGGLIGLAVDAIGGGLYAISPEQVNGQLVRVGARARVENGELYVFLVPRAEVGWERVGQFERVR